MVEELPLARVENQPYIHYQKGSLVMYWLKEVVGEAVVNRALASACCSNTRSRCAPYPNTNDFLRHPARRGGPAARRADHRPVREDHAARHEDHRRDDARKLPDGRYELTLQIEAHKRYADGKGQETEAPLDEAFDIGAFTVEPGKTGFEAESVLALSRHRIVSGQQTITLTLDKPPAWAGVDPYNKRIDRNSEDNLKAVSAQP